MSWEGPDPPRDEDTPPKRPNLEGVIKDPQAATGNFRGPPASYALLRGLAKYALWLEEVAAKDHNLTK